MIKIYPIYPDELFSFLIKMNIWAFLLSSCIYYIILGLVFLLQDAYFFEFENIKIKKFIQEFFDGYDFIFSLYYRSFDKKKNSIKYKFICIYAILLIYSYIFSFISFNNEVLEKFGVILFSFLVSILFLFAFIISILDFYFINSKIKNTLIAIYYLQFSFLGIFSSSLSFLIMILNIYTEIFFDDSISRIIEELIAVPGAEIYYAPYITVTGILIVLLLLFLFLIFLLIHKYFYIFRIYEQISKKNK